MKTRKTQTKNEYSHPAANESPEKHRRKESTAQFADNRSNAVAQKKLQEKLENSPLVEKTASLKAMVSPDSASKKSMQLAKGKDNWEHLKSKGIKSGQRVSFDVDFGMKGDKAINVRVD